MYKRQEQAGHVFEFKSDEFRASAHCLIAHEQQDLVSETAWAVILRLNHLIEIEFCERLGLSLRAQVDRIMEKDRAILAALAGIEKKLENDAEDD